MWDTVRIHQLFQQFFRKSVELLKFINDKNWNLLWSEITSPGYNPWGFLGYGKLDTIVACNTKCLSVACTDVPLTFKHLMMDMTINFSRIK